MSILKKLKFGAAAALMAASFMVPLQADAATKIRVQSVIPATADEIVMLKDFAGINDRW